MRFQQHNGQYSASKDLLGIVAMIVVLMIVEVGCATSHRTTRRETIVRAPDRGAEEQTVQTTTTTVTTSTDQDHHGVVPGSVTDTTTTETTVEHPGLLSSTFHAIGYVISLPFILIGGLFRTIFGG